MDIWNVISQMTVLLVLMAVGYVSCRAGWIDGHSNRFFAKVLINVACPCMMLSSLSEAKTGERGLLVRILICAVALFVILPVLAKLLRLLTGFGKEEAFVYEIMFYLSNMGFMGMPVVASVYGADGILYIAIFNLVYNFLMYGYAASVLDRQGGLRRGFEVKKLFSPPIAAGFVTLLFYSFAWRFPPLLERCIDSLGAMTTPLAMMVVGANLAMIPAKKIFLNWRIYVMCAVRLLLMPVLIYLVFSLFVSESLLLGVITLIAAMPVAANLPVLCQFSGLEPASQTASQGVLVSTVLSVLTIPLIAVFMNGFGML